MPSHSFQGHAPVPGVVGSRDAAMASVTSMGLSYMSAEPCKLKRLPNPLSFIVLTFTLVFTPKPAYLLEVLLAPSTGHGWGLAFSPLITTLRN